MRSRLRDDSCIREYAQANKVGLARQRNSHVAIRIVERRLVHGHRLNLDQPIRQRERANADESARWRRAAREE